MLQLSFGGSILCSFSEMVTDLSNKIVLMPNWDPKLLHRPYQETVMYPEYVNESVPIDQAKPLVVKVPTTALGR